MTKHEKFNFRSLNGLRDKIGELGLDIPIQEDLSPLRRPVPVGDYVAPNSLGIHPMEGCDGDSNGIPSDLTFRRYERFASGGAGVLWFEATAVVPEGRANPRQLWIHEGNVREFGRLLDRTSRIARDSFGDSGMPLMVLQLTHSGRYSRPEDRPAPVIAYHNPALDAKLSLPPDYPTITDGQLEALEDKWAGAAKLAWDAGFKAVDIKTVHGYLAEELLSAHNRPGRYGGSFENRTQFLRNVIDKVKMAAPGMIIAVRLNACDWYEYPWAWGMDKSTPGREDLTEPIQLVKILHQKGVRLVNVSAGNPYYNPHVGRPFDQPTRGSAPPAEHPLEGVARLLRLARQVQQAVPEMAIMSTGYSWLRQYFPYAGAAMLANGWTKVVGVGREAFAYPDFARDLLEKGSLDPRKVCTSCSKCTQLMRDDCVTGCVTRDGAVYAPIYKMQCLAG